MQNSFYEMDRDGVTQSLISMWLSCRQKAKFYLQGWESKYAKEALIDGNIGHAVLEYAYLDVKVGKLKSPPDENKIRKYTDIVEAMWRKEHNQIDSKARAMIDKALAVMEVLLPIYFDYWKDDFKKKQWLSLEEKWKMSLPVVGLDGKKVLIPLRGKKDGTFMGTKGTWLFETKFKAMIDEGGISETLNFETQVMLYLLETWGSTSSPVPRGCLYNIIRRTALRMNKSETVVQYAKRVKKDVEKRPEFYFIRMESPTSAKELLAFKIELTGLLTDMWNWWKGLSPHYKNTYECIGKYGKCLYLPVCGREEYGQLVKRKVVFKELEDF